MTQISGFANYENYYHAECIGISTITFISIKRKDHQNFDIKCKILIELDTQWPPLLPRDYKGLEGNIAARDWDHTELVGRQEARSSL